MRIVKSGLIDKFVEEVRCSNCSALLRVSSDYISAINGTPHTYCPECGGLIHVPLDGDKLHRVGATNRYKHLDSTESGKYVEVLVPSNPIPQLEVTCVNCKSLLELGIKDYNTFGYSSIYFTCPVCKESNSFRTYKKQVEYIQKEQRRLKYGRKNGKVTGTAGKGSKGEPDRGTATPAFTGVLDPN